VSLWLWSAVSPGTAAIPVPRRPIDDDEWSDDEDFGNDSSDTDAGECPCPACGEPVYEDAEKCPHCGEWITSPGTAERRSRTWLWPILVTILIVLILVAWHGLRR
jgi:predicted nucleic acid-binding Zn ribbon protein